MSKQEPSRRKLNRREMLGLIGAAGVIAVVGCGDDDQTGNSTNTPTQAGGSATASPTRATTASATPIPVSCVITPDLTEGPYFVDERLDRSDIRSDPTDGSVSEGVPLRFGLTVSEVNGEACTPLAGAVVDMWHCDADGAYSDISGGAGQANTSGQKFLRGYQVTDANGQVEFLTIYPGWYSGRAVHIHFKVRTDPDSQQGYEFTSQFFFEEATTEAVYARAPYDSRGSPDVTNATDNIFGQSGGELTLQLVEEGGGYAGTFHVGVNTA